MCRSHYILNDHFDYLDSHHPQQHHPTGYPPSLTPAKTRRQKNCGLHRRYESYPHPPNPAHYSSQNRCRPTTSSPMAALILAGLALAGDKLQDMRDRKREKGRARRSTLVWQEDHAHQDQQHQYRDQEVSRKASSSSLREGERSGKEGTRGRSVSREGRGAEQGGGSVRERSRSVSSRREGEEDPPPAYEDVVLSG